MTHSPYLDWLYEDANDLSEVQAGDLRNHLAGCAECRQRAEGLRRMEGVFRTTGMASPTPGFAQRWQARLQEERLRVHRLQTRLAWGVSVSATATLLGLLALMVWPYLGSAEVVFWAAAYQALTWLTVLAGVGEFLTALLRAMTGVVPVFGWLLAIGMVFELGVLWVVSYRLLTNPRRLENA